MSGTDGITLHFKNVYERAKAEIDSMIEKAREKSVTREFKRKVQRVLSANIRNRKPSINPATAYAQGVGVKALRQGLLSPSNAHFRNLASNKVSDMGSPTPIPITAKVKRGSTPQNARRRLLTNKYN